MVRSFTPQGPYGGHWGVDLAAPEGTPVRSAGRGVVSFVGRIAGRLSVTIDHGGGVRTSYSYLSATIAVRGDGVTDGAVIALSGIDHGVPAVHYSVRVGARYVAPPLDVCNLVPGKGIRLSGITRRATYPRVRATRHPRRDVRSPPSRSPGRR